MKIDIVRRTAGADCAAILAELPEWFGIPESNRAYAELAGREPAWVAEASGQPLGIMILKAHPHGAVENYLLAVRPAAHCRGVGRSLLQKAEAVCRDRGSAYLTVKTLGPSFEYEPYARTRAFYRAMGFAPLEEFTEIWGPENPCLFMVKPVTSAPA